VSAPRGKLESLHPRPVPPAKLAHVVIRTSRFDESRRWYSTVLAAAPAYENEQLCFMTYDDEHHRVGIINMPQLGEISPALNGVEHFAFTFDGFGELLATYRRLKRAGIEPFWTINHGPTISFYYRDPDGNKIELQYDVLRTPAEVNAFFDSGAYEENFMGIIVDADQLAQDYEDGVPLEQLVARPPLPPGMTPWDMHRP
jgi:catechol 2,3-dioxygenase-like lactoylglutathione lyase family enzyme